MVSWPITTIVPSVPGRFPAKPSSPNMSCFLLSNSPAPALLSLAHRTCWKIASTALSLTDLHRQFHLLLFIPKSPSPAHLYSNAMSNNWSQQIDSIDPRLLLLDEAFDLVVIANQQHALRAPTPDDRGGPMDQAAAQSGTEAR